MKCLTLVFCIIIFNYTNIKADEKIILQIEDGKIQGEKRISLADNNKYVYSFKGIPFAKPPIGDLRFLPPEPNESWNGILNATEYKDHCILKGGSGSEDCLYINVYTSSLTKKNMSVMFSIHGGAFVAGKGKLVPDFLLNEDDIVLVSFDYRIGVFGFLCAGDSVLPGNMGLKDQILALRWVQKNIKHFGGNSEDVTIFGESAGGASVGYHLQIHQTKGLFHKAIMQSGNTLCSWSLARKCSEVAFALGRSLLIFTTNTTTLFKRLQKVNAELLHLTSLKVSITDIKNPLDGLIFGPVKEPHNEGAIFTGNSHQMLSDGKFHKVPILIGCNSEEARLVDALPDVVRLSVLKYDFKHSNIVPTSMNVSSNWIKSFIGRKIKKKFFGFLPAIKDKENVIKFISFDQFERATLEAARQYSKYVKVYFYVFSYRGYLGTKANVDIPGVGHTEDLPYLFGRNNVTPTSEDIITMKRMCKWWTNFAKFGNPTPSVTSLFQNLTWFPSNHLNEEDLLYLNINNSLEMKTNPEKEKFDFYKELYEMYGQPPFDTY